MKVMNFSHLDKDFFIELEKSLSRVAISTSLRTRHNAEEEIKQSNSPPNPSFPLLEMIKKG